MAMQLRYRDNLVSSNDVVWRIELWQEAPAPFAAIGALDFPHSAPLEIEWPAEDKEVPVLGSSATLTIISPGDRTYEDLYTIKAGSVRMDVYHEGSLYWSGCLDPEFYEEPYEAASGYLVSLTFTDFGILDRLKYNLTGMRTLREILTDAIDRSGISVTGIAGYRTTTLPDNAVDILDAVAVRSENFTDEEGEASTLREVLEGVLQPLALRMIQRAGEIHVYDLNGLYHGPAIENRIIYWQGDSSTMSADKAANNAKITFSPYAEAALSTGAVGYTDEYRKRAINPWPSMYLDFGGLFSFYETLKPHDLASPTTWDSTAGDNLRALHFTIHTSQNGSGLKINNAKYFHIQPLFRGPSECDGIAVMFSTGCIPRDGARKSQYPTLAAPFPAWNDDIVYPGMIGEALHSESYYTSEASAVLAQLPAMSIPKLDASDAAMTLLRIKLDMLLDCRYNPFSDEKNDNDDYDVWQWRARFAFVPISLVLRGNSGKTYVYANYELAQLPEGDPESALGWVLGAWKEVTPSAAKRKYAYLAFYDPDDYDKESGALHGWTTNRQCVGRCKKPLGRQLKGVDEGQYIPYPPDGGTLEFTLYKGVNGYSYDEKINALPSGSLGMAEP